MIEVEGEPVAAFKQANEELMDAYVDLMEGQFNYIDSCDIVFELIHTIRTYDNMRRRSLINQIRLESDESCT